MKTSLLMAALLASVSLNANATLIAQASCNTPNPNVRTLDIGTSSASCALSADYTYYSFNMSGTGSAAASSQYGVLKARATSTGADSWGTGSTSNAGFSDSLTISAAGMEGKRGTVTFGFSLDWNALQEHDAAGWSNVTTSFSVFASNIAGGGANHSFRLYQADTSGNSATYTAYNDGKYVDTAAPLEITIPFYFGYAFSLDVSLLASAGGGGNGVFVGSWSSMMDASHSAYWTGVKGFTSETTLTNPWTLTSASGTDYNRSFRPAQDVPEPGSIALLTAGLLGIARSLLGRKRKQRSAA